MDLLLLSIKYQETLAPTLNQYYKSQLCVELYKSFDACDK